MFKNLKITAKMGSPIAITENINLDTLILLGALKCKLEEEFYYRQDNIYCSIEEAKEILSPILDMELDVFCASYGFGNSKEFVTRWSKRFCNKNDNLIMFTGKGKQRIETGSGHFKNYHMPLIVRSFKEVIFYARGNKEEIEKALNYVYYIGKKSSQGYGEVREWIIEEIEENFSILDHFGKPMRNIPARLISNLDVSKKYEFKEMALYPPYRRKEKELCII